MGLFSFLSKNKQEAAAEDSGYYDADDTAVAAQARSKRASNAGGAARRNAKPAVDPVLPEKKRARRRLVGAVALALAVAIGLPMILDSEQKPLASDIAFQIPSKDKPAPDAVPAPPASTGAPSSKVPATAALDQSEEIVTPPANPPAKTPPPADAKPHVDTRAAVQADGAEAGRADAKAAAKAEAKSEAEAKARREADARREAKARDEEAKTRLAETKPAPKPKTEDRPASNTSADDDARALAILEGKAAPKGEPKGEPKTETASSKFIVQVAALATQDKADELQGKLRDAGIKSYTQKTPSGDTIRVRVGPLSKDEAEKIRARLAKIGLSGSLVPA